MAVQLDWSAVKNLGTTITVAGAITAGGWWLIRPHAEEFIEKTLADKGYVLQEQVDDLQKEIEASRKEQRAIGVLQKDTRRKVQDQSSKIDLILELLKKQERRGNPQ